MRAKLFLMLSTALLCSGECIQVGPPQFGRIEIQAFSSLERLPNFEIDLVQVGSGKSLTSKFHGAVASRIPYGLYRVRVSAPGFRSIERELLLDQPALVVRAQLTVSMECGGSAQIDGSIQPAPGGRELWVKVVPAIGSGGSEAPVGRDGKFLIAGLDGGDYLLLVLDGKSIVHTRTLEAFGEKHVTVELGKL